MITLLYYCFDTIMESTSNKYVKPNKPADYVRLYLDEW